MADLTDPDRAAELFVMQWMHENGHMQALCALEGALGRQYDADVLPQASQLMQLVWRNIEEQLAEGAEAGAEGAAEGAAASAAARQAEAERLLRAGSGDYACVPQRAVEGAHPANIISVRVLPGEEAVVTGSGDGQVRRVRWDGEVEWATGVGSGSVLSLALHPRFSEEPLVAASSMDGSIHVLHAVSGALLASSKPHAKYVVRVVWAPDGCTLATASHDETACLHRYRPGCSAGGAEGGVAATITTIQPLLYANAVHDVAFLPDGRTLVVAVRGTALLGTWDITDLKAGERKVNMNAAGDAHVSFTAKHLAASPCGKYLLVCTDSPRLLVLRTSDWSPLRTLFGLPVDHFPQPVAAWHRDSNYIYVAGAGAQVCVFHLGSGKQVAHLQGHHKVNVRDLDYDALRNLLVTCSFDKSVKVFGAATEGGEGEDAAAASAGQ